MVISTEGVDIRMEVYVRVLEPVSGCPKGTILEVNNIQNDGTVVGMDAENSNNWTSFYIPFGSYDFVNYIPEDSAPKYPDDNIVRFDNYDGLWMVGNEDIYSLIMKYEGKAIKIVEIGGQES